MVHDERTMGGLVSPVQHIGMHYYQKYEARNKPMPFAVAIGVEPVTPIVASAAMPDQTDEAGIVGAIRGEPIEVVKCETVDLEVPAAAEVVIEGEMPPYERREEGPFGEYTGYLRPGRDKKPVYKVTAISHRNDPIITVVCPGAPVEDHLCTTITKAAELLDELRSQGYPVKMVFIPPMAAVHLAVISTEAKFPNIAKEIANAIWSTKSGKHIPKLVVVEDDIDATDMDQVLWSFCTRNHPDKGIFKLTDVAALPLWPFLSPGEKESLISATVLFDCTWPKDWPKEYVPKKSTFDSLWPKEIQEKVLAKWGKYGYKR